MRFLSCALLLLASTAFAQSNERQTLVFFDIQVDSALEDVRGAERFLTSAMGNALARGGTVTVMDRATRDALLLQRRFSLADCSKAECRFAMARALPGVNLMAEAQIEKLGSQCGLSLVIKSTKTGAIVSAVDEKSTCDPESLVDVVRGAASRVASTLDAPPQAIAAPVALPGSKLAPIQPLMSDLSSGRGITGGEALAAWNLAIGRESIGHRDPDGAAQAWRVFAHSDIGNPYVRQGRARAAEWQKLANRKRSEIKQLLQIVTSSHSAAPQKAALAARFREQYGEESYRDLFEKSATLKVVSNPPGARIALDGSYFFGDGWTPDTLSIRPGWHDVEVYKRFQRPKVTSVFAMPLSTTTIVAPLAEARPWWVAANFGAALMPTSLQVKHTRKIENEDGVERTESGGSRRLPDGGSISFEAEAGYKSLSAGGWYFDAMHYDVSVSGYGLQGGLNGFGWNNLRYRGAARLGLIDYTDTVIYRCMGNDIEVWFCDASEYQKKTSFAVGAVLGLDWFRYAQLGADVGAYYFGGNTSYFVALRLGGQY